MEGSKESSVSVHVEGREFSSIMSTPRGLLAVLSLRGEVHLIDEETGRSMCIARSGDNSDTRSAAFEPAGEGEDEASGRLYVTDMAAGAVMQIQEGEEAAEGTQDDNVFVNEYEGNALNGPHTIRFGPDGSMFFTDAGPFGDATIQEPRGSVYCVGVDHSGAQVLKPIVSSCLASPAGLAVSPNGNAIYVCEMLKNRLLRFVQYPTGVWQCSVYHQFSGRMGPVAVCCAKDGTLYVARFDTRNCADKGVVSVLSPEGEFERNIMFPGPEITGVALSRDQRSLFVTEKSQKAVYKAEI